MKDMHEVELDGTLYNVEFSREWTRDYNGNAGYDYHFFHVAEVNPETGDYEAVTVDRNLEWKLSEKLDEVN